MKLPAGTIGYHDAKGIFAWLQHIFSGKGASHAFLITYPIGFYRPTEMVFEADLTVRHWPLEKYLAEKSVPKQYFFQVKGMETDELHAALDRCTNDFSGCEYGFLQLLWFPWRWFKETILRKDARHDKNWFTDGVICTELWWWFLWYATELRPTKWGRLRAILEQWNPDTIQAYDCMNIMRANPDIFVPYAQNIDGVFSYIN